MTSSTRNRPRPTSTTSGFRAAAKPPVSSLPARYYEQDGIYRVGDEKFRQLNARAKGTVNIANG